MKSYMKVSHVQGRKHAAVFVRSASLKLLTVIKRFTHGCGSLTVWGGFAASGTAQLAVTGSKIYHSTIFFKILKCSVQPSVHATSKGLQI